MATRALHDCACIKVAVGCLLQCNKYLAVRLLYLESTGDLVAGQIGQV